MKTNEQMIADHLAKFPKCTQETCPHTKDFTYMVIFHEPDMGFIGTCQALDLDQCEQVVRNGLSHTHPHLHVKKIKVDYADIGAR
jgi:hypothetical protein